MTTVTVWLLIAVSYGGYPVTAQTLSTHPTEDACRAVVTQLEEDAWSRAKYRCVKSESVFGGMK